MRTDGDDFLIDSILDPDATQDTSVGEYAADGTRRAVGPVKVEPALRRTSGVRALRQGLREKTAAQVVGKLPDQGDELILILSGRFHGIDLITAAIDLAGETVEHAYFATLAINKTHVSHLASMIDDGRIRTITMVISEVFSENSKPEFNFLHDELTKRGCRIVVSRNHAKLVSLEFSGGRKLAMHGSLNLRRCSSYEQVAIVADDQIADFFKSFILDVANGEAVKP